MCFQAGSLHCGSLLRQGGSESPARGGSQVRAAGSAAAAYTALYGVFRLTYPRNHGIIEMINARCIHKLQKGEMLHAD